MLSTLTDADDISRCIIYDRAFADELHSDDKLWQFDSSADANGIYHQSAVARRLAPRPVDVHAIGCGIAAAQNERKGDPPPGRQRRYYCGFRTASHSDLPLVGDGYRVTLCIAPEDGVDAHVDVALEVEGATRGQRANNRTNAGMALAEVFGLPEPHVCDRDSDDTEHPIARNGVECLFTNLRHKWQHLRL